MRIIPLELKHVHSAQTPPSLGSSLLAAGMKNVASVQWLHAAEGFLCVLSQWGGPGTQARTLGWLVWKTCANVPTQIDSRSQS